MKQKKLVFIILALLFLALIITALFTNENTSNYGKLYINEVMANNAYTIQDEDGDYSDYIELYNGYNFDINLEGYYLSDKEYKTSKYVFSDVVIKKNSYLLVFASGKNKYNEYVHTNFKLNENGETLTLTDKNNNILSKVRYQTTAVNTSNGYNGRKYVYYYEGTPNAKNKGKYSNNPIKLVDSKASLKITEYILKNESIYDVDGDYSPMVEIYNEGEDVSLKNLFISDNLKNPNRYMLPDVVLKSKSYVVIYLSGKNKYQNNEIHTNFKIKNNEDIIISSATGKEIDSVKVKEVPLNTSLGLFENEWYYFPTPTFGFDNNTAKFKSLGGNNE